MHFELTGPMIGSLTVTVVLIVLSLIATHNMKMVPSGLQNLAEWAIGGLYNFFGSMMEEKMLKRYFPFICTFFIYIMFCNYCGLIPGAGMSEEIEEHIFAAPTSTVNFPAAMALIVFVGIQVVGIREQGLRCYKKMLFSPFAFLFPLMLVEMFVKPMSLTFRLYGNIFGEESVIHQLSNMVPILVPCIMMALSVLMGLIQALVFSLLCTIYWSEAGEVEEGEDGAERLVTVAE